MRVSKPVLNIDGMTKDRINDPLRRPLSGREILGHVLPLLMIAIPLVSLWVFSGNEIVRTIFRPLHLIVIFPALYLVGSWAGRKLLEAEMSDD